MTEVCRSTINVTGDKISPALSTLPTTGIHSGSYISAGLGNTIGGNSAIGVVDTDGLVKSLPTTNHQLVVGNNNTALFDNIIVIGSDNSVENSGISIINGKGNTVTSIDTVLIGTKNQTIDDSGKVYLGNVLSVDVETGDIFKGGTKVDRVFEKTIRIASADLLELDSVPVRLISGVGATEYVVINAVSMYLDFNTTAYTGDNDLEVYIDGAENDYFIGEQFLTATATGVYDFEKFKPTTVGNQSILGGDGYIRLKNSTSDGDSDIIITIDYRVIDIAGY